MTWPRTQLPEGYRITFARSFGYNMAYLADPGGQVIAQEMVHTLTSGTRAARRARRNLVSIARVDARNAR